MIVAGVMSGTSADGINVALVRVSASSPRPTAMPTLHFLAHAEYRYPKQVRQTVLAAMNSTKASVADLARLNFLLAELYADALLATQRRFHLKAELDRLPRSDSLSSGRTGPVSGTQACRHLANRRRRSAGCTRRRPGGFRFPACRYGRRRKRSAPCSLPRLSFVSRPPCGPNCAEHRRNCKLHRHSCERFF